MPAVATFRVAGDRRHLQTIPCRNCHRQDGTTYCRSLLAMPEQPADIRHFGENI
jgi:hypothetical protein